MTNQYDNWKETKDGWEKDENSHVPGNAPFNNPEPVVRDDAGRPMADDRSSIDIGKWVEEVNNGKWPPKED